MEIPDVIVVNKADHPLTDTMVREIRGVLSLAPQRGWRVPIVKTEAVARRGRRGAGRAARRAPGLTSRPRARSPSAAGATCATRSSALCTFRLRRAPRGAPGAGRRVRHAARRGRRAAPGSRQRRDHDPEALRRGRSGVGWPPVITGAHAIVFAQDAEAARAFFADVLDLRAVDAGGGWLIFALPPAELACHPTAPDDSGRHELYLMCDDVEATVADLRGQAASSSCTPISDEGFGRMTRMRRARRRRARPVRAGTPHPVERHLTRSDDGQDALLPVRRGPLHAGTPATRRCSPSTAATPSSSTRATSATTRSGRTPTVDVIAGLDWDRVYPLAGPIAVDGAAARRHAGHRDARPPHPGLGMDGDPARARAARRRLPRCLPADLRPHRGRRDLPARGHRDPDRAVHGHDGRVPGGRERAADHAAGPLRRQPGHAPAHARHDALPARPGRRRALQLRRRPRRPGRRRGVRDRPRVADVRRAALHAAQGPPDPRAAVPHGRAAGAARGRRPWYGTTGVGPRPLRRRPGGGAGDGRPPRRRARPLARGRLPALQPVRRPAHLGDRRRRTSTSSARCCRWRSSPARRLAA